MSEHEQQTHNEPVNGEGNTNRELSEDERTRRRQQHNEGVTHGGVAQIGDFDVDQQREEREHLHEERGYRDDETGYLNEGDPALPTVTEEHLNAEAGEEDRDSEALAERQGEVPGQHHE